MMYVVGAGVYVTENSPRTEAGRGLRGSAINKVRGNAFAPGRPAGTGTAVRAESRAGSRRRRWRRRKVRGVIRFTVA